MAVQACLEQFVQMIEHYLDEKDDYQSYSYGIHEKENEADQIRRRIETGIYEGAFMPLFREDFITLVELVDRVANRSEIVSDIIGQQAPDIPEYMKDDLRKLARSVIKCFDPLTRVIAALDQSWEETHKLAQQVEEIEQETDEIERRMIEELFQQEDIPLGEKLQLRDLIQYIASITDRMEDASDRVDIMLIKRKV